MDVLTFSTVCFFLLIYCQHNLGSGSASTNVDVPIAITDHYIKVNISLDLES